MNLYRVVHPNRGMLYFLLAAAIILLIVFWYSQLFVIEQEQELIQQQPISQETQQTPANSAGVLDTSNWKTYRNEKYGFELKYPDDWHREETIDGFWIDNNKTGEQRGLISIAAEQNKFSSFENYIENIIREMRYSPECSKQPRTIQGRSAVDLYCTSRFNLGYRALFINNRNIIRLNRDYSLVSQNSVILTFDAILSTLTFFEQKR